MRTLVMGDVHGGYKGMIQALERAKFDKEKDTLISLGDIADGWSEVPECVEYLLSCDNLIAIRGNHDMWCRNWMMFGEVQRVWKNQGGKATIDAYGRVYETQGYKERDIYMERHTKFFRTQLNYYIDEQNRGFVHGGFISKRGLGHEPYESNYFWDRDLWQLAMRNHKINKIIGFETTDPEESEEAKAHATRYFKHEELFIGHTSTVNWNTDKPMHYCNIWNLDTGGGFKGKITVMDVNTKEYWQSDLLPELYPDEYGR